jgi:hypothetical protein
LGENGFFRITTEKDKNLGIDKQCSWAQPINPE